MTPQRLEIYSAPSTTIDSWLFGAWKLTVFRTEALFGVKYPSGLQNVITDTLNLV